VIAHAVDRIQAIEQRLTEKTDIQLQARLTIRACLKELRDISRQRQAVTSGRDSALQPAN
jgi:hypothetical protein